MCHLLGKLLELSSVFSVTSPIHQQMDHISFLAKAFHFFPFIFAFVAYVLNYLNKTSHLSIFVFWSKVSSSHLHETTLSYLTNRCLLHLNKRPWTHGYKYNNRILDERKSPLRPALSSFDSALCWLLVD